MRGCTGEFGTVSIKFFRWSFVCVSERLMNMQGRIRRRDSQS